MNRFDRVVQFVGLSGYSYPHTRVRCYNFASELRRHGFKTRVMSFHDRIAPNTPEAEMYGLSDRKRISLILRALIRLLRYPRSVLYIQKLHYHSLSALWAARLTGQPYILDYDDFEIGADPYGVPLFCGFKNNRFQDVLFGSAEPEKILASVAGKAAFCVAASGFLREHLLTYTQRVVYIPTGVDTDRFVSKKTYESGPPVTVLWNGVVWGEIIRDNVLFLIDVISSLVSSGFDVVLKIVGRGPFMSEVRSYARRSGFNDRFQFIDWIEPDEMCTVVREADIGVLPLVNDDPWTRGKSPTKLFEYMASGLPVVVSNRGEAVSVVRNEQNGLIADGRDQFIESLKRLIISAQSRRELGESARKTVMERYSLPVLGSTLAETLKTYIK